LRPPAKPPCASAAVREAAFGEAAHRTATISAVATWHQAVRDILHGIAYGRYERELRLQANQLNDLFLLLCYMEIVGLPNPATLYLLDIYPYLLDQFHLWHRRMGMDHSPLGNLPCC
jgi:hypothetical protein